MKFLKNKFYIHSFLIYLLFALSALVMAIMFLKIDMDSFFIKNFTSLNSNDGTTAIVVIDQPTYDIYNDWNRNYGSYMYELLDYFDTYSKPKVIGLDNLLNISNPKSESSVLLVDKISKMKNLVLSFVPGQITKDNTAHTEALSKFRLNQTGADYKIGTDYNNIAFISDLLLDKANNLGSVKMPDKSSSTKTFFAPNLVRINDNYYPSLSLKMYLTANGANDISIDDKFVYIPKTQLKIPHNGKGDKHLGYLATNIKFYSHRVYKDVKGNLVTSQYTHDAISAYKIIKTYKALKYGEKIAKEDFINPEVFDGTTIFIGEFSDGPSTDVINTPMASRQPGVDVQATVYDNLRNNDFLYYAGFFVSLFILLIISVLTFICIFRLKFLKGLFLLFTFDVIFFIICVIFAINAYIIDFIGPISVQLVTLIFGYSFKFITENRNKEKIKQAMGKYLSQDIMKNVVSNIDDLKLGGKRAVVTVLFSDIRGFTSMSEKMSAEEVSMILNEYFTEIEPIITKHNGVINKFIGDAVMAIFGEPIQDINHPQNAVKCAYEMLKKVEYLREKWLFEGKPKIEIGVGINTGEVFIGNIGSESRMEYTVIGDTVNLASRIESYNKVYKTNLLVSSSTYSYISNIADVIKISEVQIRGKAKKMNIYEVLRMDMNK